MKLVFATNNQNKVNEIKSLLGEGVEILSLKDIGCNEELPETQETLEGNALQKARYVADNYNVNCFADDTGLEVESLNGAPGVYSARYAGEQCTAEDNMTKILSELEGKENRQAKFRTIVALILKGEEHSFEGIIDGSITRTKSGSDGFGYDPIFQPNGFDGTFSEMSMAEKNAISHRGKAVAKLIEFLKGCS
jgi:XTP/dITP diphosphohydrolase